MENLQEAIERKVEENLIFLKKVKEDLKGRDIYFLEQYLLEASKQLKDKEINKFEMDLIIIELRIALIDNAPFRNKEHESKALYLSSLLLSYGEERLL